jgi:hypothetical protein|tara:strand:+ start:412 stop:681 length:270 start_codon:yes stop_codon:yes gene_type:complete
MEKIIFFALVIPILGFVFYLGGTAIMKGFKAKLENKPDEDEGIGPEDNNTGSNINENLSGELIKLNELLKSKILTQEEFDKAKKKLLDS